MKETQQHIYGKNAVTEALAAEQPLEKIFLSFGATDKALHHIRMQAKSKGIPCVTQDKKKFRDLERQVCPKDSRSQGVIALMRSFSLVSVEEIIMRAKTLEFPLIVVLDEITDPHNLGAIARSAECSGAAGLILTERNSSPITPTAVKASAGALEHIPVAKVSSVVQTFELLKDNGFWIIGTSEKADKLYTDKIYDSPVVLALGSEGKGLRPSTQKHCDILVRIPMKGNISSLNASVAAGVIMFEISRQRGSL